MVVILGGSYPGDGCPGWISGGYVDVRGWISGVDVRGLNIRGVDVRGGYPGVRGCPGGYPGMDVLGGTCPIEGRYPTG